MKLSWVYILKCSDGSYYTGCTTNFEKRINQHQFGVFGGYTSSRLPVEIVWSQEFSELQDAIAVERQIKRWSRKKKEALIKGDFGRLHDLAQSKEMIVRRKKRAK